MRRLPKPLRQIAALALLGGVVAIIAALIASPMVTYLSDVQERIANERLLLSRFTALAAHEDDGRELQRRRAELNADGEFLEGESEAIKLANLQSMLAAIAANNGLRVHSARTLPAHERGKVRLIGVRVQLHADMARIQKTLHDIEGKRPLLFIEAAQISHLSGGDTAEAGAMLDARFDVFGAVMRKGE
ncbi:MAG TPA: type II secretion system protein GspM [Hyphomicrobiaceae bacterium]|jgi:hypothetical protein|nr:type II secretion system protein GspM [Hyphomicrobiaceae bacterium]